MSIFVLGLNHNTAPIGLREKYTFTPKTIENAYSALLIQPWVKEAMLFSTCNRTEIYVIAINKKSYIVNHLKKWLIDFFHSSSKKELTGHLFYYKGKAALEHLIKVSCGLDSLIIGEPQILGQIKESYKQAVALGGAKQKLNYCLQSTFSVAKEVRNKTEIGNLPVSISFASVVLTKKFFGNLHDKEVLLIGAGDTITLLTQYLLEQGVTKFKIANRTRANADKFKSRLPNKIICEVLNFKNINSALSQVDVVYSATSNETHLVDKNMVAVSLKQRKKDSLFIVDLAVPRNFDPKIEQLNNVYLYSVDDLKKIITENRAQRMEQAKLASKIVKKSCKRIFKAIQTKDLLASLICDYRQQVDEIKEQVLQKYQKRIEKILDCKNTDCSHNDCSCCEVRALIGKLAQQLSNKIMHVPCDNLEVISKKNDSFSLELAKKVLLK